MEADEVDLAIVNGVRRLAVFYRGGAVRVGGYVIDRRRGNRGSGLRNFALKGRIGLRDRGRGGLRDGGPVPYGGGGLGLSGLRDIRLGLRDGGPVPYGLGGGLLEDGLGQAQGLNVQSAGQLGLYPLRALEP